MERKQGQTEWLFLFYLKCPDLCKKILSVTQCCVYFGLQSILQLSRIFGKWQVSKQSSRWPCYRQKQKWHGERKKWSFLSASLWVFRRFPDWEPEQRQHQLRGFIVNTRSSLKTDIHERSANVFRLNSRSVFLISEWQKEMFSFVPWQGNISQKNWNRWVLH